MLRRFRIEIPALWLCLTGAALPQNVIRVPTDHATIQQAIAAATLGDMIDVAPGVYPGALLLSESLVLSGADPATTVIDATGSGLPAIGTSGFGQDRSVIQGFTITGGNSGIYITGGHITVMGCRIVGNASTGSGGGIYADSAVVDVRNCTIAFNTATSAGGGLCFGYPSAGTIADCRVHSNVAGTSGGGISFWSDGAPFDTIEGCAIHQNTAGGAGGGVAFPALAVPIDRCAVWWNHATTFGGGIAAAPNPVDVRHALLWFNTPDLASGPVNVTWSAVQGGTPGLGNISAYPMPADPANGDFTLLPGSPAIDAGDPAAPVDADGTRPDMGPGAPSAGLASWGGGSGGLVAGIGAFGTPPELTIAGSAGNLRRRIDVPRNQPFTIAMAATPFGGGPTSYVVFGYFGEPAYSARVSLSNVGPGTFVPCPLAPADPLTFLFADGFGGVSGCPPVFATGAAPTAITLSSGIPIPLRVVLQGVFLQNSMTLRYTNALLLNIY